MQCFGNIFVKISPNDNKMDIFRIYTERAIKKMSKMEFLDPLEAKKLKKQSVYNFAGHPV